MNRLDWTNHKEVKAKTSTSVQGTSLINAVEELRFAVHGGNKHILLYSQALVLFKDHIFLGWASITGWHYFTHAWIDELNFWTFTCKGGIFFLRGYIGIRTSMNNNPNGTKAQNCSRINR